MNPPTTKAFLLMSVITFSRYHKTDFVFIRIFIRIFIDKEKPAIHQIHQNLPGQNFMLYSNNCNMCICGLAS